MQVDGVRSHVGLAREPFRAERTLELGRRAAFVDHVPAQQLLPVGALVEVTAPVRADRRVRLGAPLQQRPVVPPTCSEKTTVGWVRKFYLKNVHKMF